MLRISFLILSLSLPLLSQTTETYFRISTAEASVETLIDRCSLDEAQDGFYYGYANDAEWQWLTEHFSSIEKQLHPGSRYNHKMSGSYADLSNNWDTFPTYDAYVATMQQYEIDFPQLCRLDTFGVSTQGRLLLAMKITDNPTVAEDEPEFLYTSTMHGDETTGYPLSIRLIDYLLNSYGSEGEQGERITKLINSLEIWINPLANPDGTYRNGNNSVNGAWRRNANGVDLNRDFPDRVVDPNNTTQGREQETAEMMRFVAEHNFTLSANFHGGAQVVNYPWDNGALSGSYSACPDDAWFIDVSRVYATPNQDIMNGSFSNGITNGCQWYAINGGRQDWIYVWHGGRETTIELWNTKNPPGTALPERWEQNRESFLVYMEETWKGIRGKIKDITTLQPLAAEINVIGYPDVPVFSDAEVGNFHRLLLPGSYDLAVSAPGYISDTLYAITVSDTGATRINWSLYPLLVGTGDTPANTSIPQTAVLFQNFPNPFNPNTTIRFSLPASGEVRIAVYTPLGEMVTVISQENRQAGAHQVSWDGFSTNGNSVASGVYFYRLEMAGQVLSRKMVLLR